MEKPHDMPQGMWDALTEQGKKQVTDMVKIGEALGIRPKPPKPKAETGE